MVVKHEHPRSARDDVGTGAQVEAEAPARPRRSRAAAGEQSAPRSAALERPDRLEGRRRVVIERIAPELDAGRFPVKRTAGESVRVTVDVFADGHDRVAGAVLYRHESEAAWSQVPLEWLDNDRWHATFQVTEIGRYRYTVEGWIDRFRTWREDLEKRLAVGQDVAVELQVGADLARAAATEAAGEDRDALRAWAKRIVEPDLADPPALDLDLARLMARYPDRRLASRFPRELDVVVDRERARFSTWYETFPRSTAPRPGAHGTFHDLEERLPYIASMNFDVLYLPPIHPIGQTKRKGRNNAEISGPDDVGSPWAIGAEEGGHTTIHPQLGTLADFRKLVQRADEHGLEIALDVAFQCSPDHPWVHDHPEWFLHRPDGKIRFAENPPKKYQDIYPLNFESESWQELWEALKDVFLYWIGEGVRIFRVDNPHTKPFPFWEWLITGVKREHPDIIFLSEAFTRPKVMYRLAKLGFTQSYTYFAWRNDAEELREYFTELTRTEAKDFFRPNLWPNTPDILTEQLQTGGRPAFMSRLVLAATLGASYGIYGPAFELCEHRAREPGSEEYLDSEKYEIREWELERSDSVRELSARVNRIRRENRALQWDRTLHFHDIDNPEMLVYSKRDADGSNVIVTVVNLDSRYVQSGWTQLDLRELGVAGDGGFEVHDLLTGERYSWSGARNFVRLDPHACPAHIFRIGPHLRSERDFDSYA